MSHELPPDVMARVEAVYRSIATHLTVEHGDEDAEIVIAALTSELSRQILILFDGTTDDQAFDAFVAHIAKLLRAGTKRERTRARGTH